MFKITANDEGMVCGMCEAHINNAVRQAFKEKKDSLISIMTNPTVVTDVTGGHLALLIKLDKYANTVSDYIMERSERNGVEKYDK